MLFFFFFFFQAEDGIRDLTVTGVQTCALPISMRTHWTRTAKSPARSCSTTPRTWRRRNRPAHRTASPSPPTRSEERRVGKGVDLGGRRISKKKKKDKDNE